MFKLLVYDIFMRSESLIVFVIIQKRIFMAFHIPFILAFKLGSFALDCWKICGSVIIIVVLITVVSIAVVIVFILRAVI